MTSPNPKRGHLQRQNSRLVATDKRTATDLVAAQKAVADAEHRYNVIGRTAIDSPNHVNRYVLSALAELQKTMPRRDGT